MRAIIILFAAGADSAQRQTHRLIKWMMMMMMIIISSGSSSNNNKCACASLRACGQQQVREFNR